MISTSVAGNSDESDGNNEELDVPGKKSKTNPRNNQKSLNSTPSNRVSNSNYNNIMLIKNEQIVSNSSSLKQLKQAQNHLASNCRSPNSQPVTHQVLEAAANVAAQQNPSSLGVSDRMSKEKQKFFRFSVFNSERKAKAANKQSKSSLNNNNDKASSNHNGIGATSVVDAFKYVSSSDSEREQIFCDKTSKAKGKIVAGGKKAAGKKVNHVKAKAKLKKAGKSDSSCCSSDEEDSGSSSDTSSSSSGSSSSSSGSSSTSCSSPVAPKTSLANKAESINTMNVFACINSRELTSQTKRPPYCWTAAPDQQAQSLFKKQSTKSRSFGANNKHENEVWGFAAEAKKSLNIFTASDSESRTNRNFSGTESDCQMSLLSLGSSVARHRTSRSDRDANFNTHQMPLIANSRKRSTIEYLNRRTTTLMRNNAIMSSDDDARQQLSPSKLFRKAVSYKRFDNNTMNNKKLIMDTSLNGAKYGSDERPVKEPQKPSFVESPTKPPLSPPPYNINHSDTMMGKKLSSTLSLSL